MIPTYKKRTMWRFVPMLMIVVIQMAHAEDKTSSGSEGGRDRALLVPNNDILSEVQTGYDSMVKLKASTSEYRDGMRDVREKAMSQVLKKYDIPTRIAQDALQAISKMEKAERIKRIGDWITVTSLSYSKSSRIKIIEGYLSSGETIDGLLWSNLVTAFDQECDEMLFQVLDRVKFADDDIGRYYVCLRETDYTKLSMQARKRYIDKWSEMLDESREMDSAWSRARVAMLSAALLEGDEADQAVNELETLLEMLSKLNAGGNQRIAETDAMGASRLLVDTWKQDLRENPRIKPILLQFIADSRLN